MTGGDTPTAVASSPAVGALGEELHAAAPHRIGERSQRPVDRGRARAHCQLVAKIGVLIAASACSRVTSRTCIENVQW